MLWLRSGRKTSRIRSLMENVDLEDGAAIRGVALELQKRFCPDLGSVRQRRQEPAQKKAADTAEAHCQSSSIHLRLRPQGLGLQSSVISKDRFSPEIRLTNSVLASAHVVSSRIVWRFRYATMKANSLAMRAESRMTPQSRRTTLDTVFPPKTEAERKNQIEFRKDTVSV